MALSPCFLKLMRHDLLRKTVFFPLMNAHSQKYSKLWEPDYLILAKTKTPEYDVINIQMKGYDFVVLENYQSFISKIAKAMKIDCDMAWAVPHEHMKLKRYKEKSTITEQEYSLKMYERNIQVVDVKSHIMPLFIDAVTTVCPPGVKLSIHEHTPEIEEQRYVPDFAALELEKELEDLNENKKKEKGN